jgi:pyruvate/2-oxoglutarate/acetoin dehydrogenase E1 component
MVVEESPTSGGWGSEVVASVVAACFDRLQAAPTRIASPDTPIPYNKSLEALRLPTPGDLAAQFDQYVRTGAISGAAQAGGIA